MFNSSLSYRIISLTYRYTDARYSFKVVVRSRGSNNRLVLAIGTRIRGKLRYSSVSMSIYNDEVRTKTSVKSLGALYAGKDSIYSRPSAIS
jgi:hypothetical protein